MKRVRCGLSSLALVLLTACGAEETGSVSLSVSQLDAGSSTRSAVGTFTPTSFQMPVRAVRLFRNGGEADIYSPPDESPLEFQLAAGQTAISANQGAPVGTYHSLEVDIGADGGRYVVVAGCVEMGVGATTELHCTRSDTSQSSLGGAPEPVQVPAANSIDSVLSEPIVVSTGEDVELNLYYDLTHAVTFLDEPGPAPGDGGYGRVGFGNGTSIEVKYPPMFAFIGEPPPVEIYEIQLTGDPDPSVAPNLESYYFPLDKWRVRMWAFFDDEGQALARRDVWVIEAGADGAALVSMFGNDARVENKGDGTYLIYDPDPDPAFQSWRLPSFKRETHNGSATWITPEGQKSIPYTATLVN